MWAILSGIEGNFKAYEAVLKDIYQQNQTIEDIYILGDVVGMSSENEIVIERITNPPSYELIPHVCRGWWEEQCLILHGLHSTADPTELIEEYGIDASKLLWDAIPRHLLSWIQGLDFGFVEFDCLLIHGSSVSVSEKLTPETSALTILDRINRVNVNYMFSARSHLTFNYQLQTSLIQSTVITLDGVLPTQISESKNKRLVGVGSVGRNPNQATYTIYNPYNGNIEFRGIHYV